MFYGNSPCPTNSNRGARSHKPVIFRDNAVKRLRHHKCADNHKHAILGLANLRLEDTIGSSGSKEKHKDRQRANNLYIGKLILIVNFFAQNYLPVKSLYQKFIEFQANELEEPIIKQY